MLIVLALVAGWPLLRTILLGFTDAGLGDFGESQFIGFATIAACASDPAWWRAVWNTLGFTLISVSIETILGLIIAPHSWNAHLKGRGIVRAAVLIPWADSDRGLGQDVGLDAERFYGVVNAMLLSLGVID